MSEHPQMTAYLAEARWFAGKGRDYEVVEVTRVGTLPGPPAVTIDLVTVRYAADDAGTGEPETEHYQMPLSHYEERQDRIGHAYVGPHDDDQLGFRHSYDAVHDRDAMAVYLQAFATHRARQLPSYGGLTFHRLPGHDLDLESHSTLFRGEQSNSSVAFGDDSLMKVFRKVTPGRNPDIEIHRALTAAQSPHVAALYGWIEHEENDLAMLQQFLRTASDGWDLALASARNLFAEADLHADEVGGDFAGEAHRLGVAVSEVHEVLREHFGTSAFDAAASAEAMRRGWSPPRPPYRSWAAHRGAPGGLRPDRRRSGAGPAGARRPAPGPDAAHLAGLEARRLRGRAGQGADRAAAARLPLARRRRDAAVLRLRRAVGGQGPARHRRARLADHLPRRGVGRPQPRGVPAGLLPAPPRRRGRSPDAAEHALVDAYEADKAVYEVVYEARNRPTWLDIPLGAIERIGADTMTGTTIGEIDVHLINEGRHEQLWQALGAHVIDGGTAFRVWAPDAQEVQVRGDFNGWDGSRSPLDPGRLLGRLGGLRPRRELGRRLQVPRARRRRRLARQGRPDGLPHRGPAGHRVADLRRAPTPGPTTSGWPRAPPTDRPDQAADVGLRGAPRLVEEAPGRRCLHLRRPGRAPHGVRRRRWASPTSSCCP